MAEGNVNSVELGSGARFGVSPGDVHSHLELLADMGRDFATSLDLEATLARAVQRITDYVDAEAGGAVHVVPVW